MKPSTVGMLAGLIVALVVAVAAQPMLDVREEERGRILSLAPAAMAEPIVTITAFVSPRSAGGPHDFHSEGDYWWPDSANPGGPYVRRDGLTNPENFVKHRQALFAMNRAVATLAAAAVVTGERRYAERALAHLRAWFVTPATRMNPHLLYAQAIHGRVTGRGIGIIDTIHLIEAARAVQVLVREHLLSDAETRPIVQWFADYERWLTTHPYGLEERAALNNHGTWWVAQVAALASLTGDAAMMDTCRRRFKEVLLPGQMALDGSFPLETSRTKPYAYSLFNFEGFALIARVASTPGDDLWSFRLPDGRGVRRGLEFILPHLADRSHWPFPPDVMHNEHFPVRFLFLLTAGQAYRDAEAIRRWRLLPADPSEDEVQRNMPLRQPLLWTQD